TRYTGEKAQEHAFSLYRLFKGVYEKQNGGLGGCAVLDFGCGWGRVTRFFLKDVAPSQLWGIDIRSETIDIAKKLFQGPGGAFEVTNAPPPTTFAEGTFSLVFSYSVFSHLSEEVHYEWLSEFNRILKPGGVVIATTLPRGFIEMVNSFRENG